MMLERLSWESWASELPEPVVAAVNRALACTGTVLVQENGDAYPAKTACSGFTEGMLKCARCGQVFADGASPWSLEMAFGALRRLVPGTPVPSGSCQFCGGFVYPDPGK